MFILLTHSGRSKIAVFIGNKRVSRMIGSHNRGVGGKQRIFTLVLDLPHAHMRYKKRFHL